MLELSLRRADAADFTILSNAFIDRYMPSANGEYIKVYLYLLRHSAPDAGPFSITQAAEALDHTDNFLLKALTYWQECGILSLTKDAQDRLTGITLQPIPASPAKTASVQSMPHVSHSELSATSEVPMDTAPAPTIPPKPSYTLSDKKRLSADESFKQVCFVTEAYLGKTLGPTQLEQLMYIYDKLHFDLELIEYLVEYCVGRGKKSMRYVEATAIGWLQQGITNVTQAKERVSLYSRLSAAVQREFGINSRSLVPEERAFIDKWMEEYRLSDELVIEACRRTRKSTGKGSFEYADSILNAWFTSNIHTMEDVAAADVSHQQTAKTNRSSAASKAPFPQRDYNMDDLEKQLLNSN